MTGWLEVIKVLHRAREQVTKPMMASRTLMSNHIQGWLAVEPAGNLSFSLVSLLLSMQTK